MLTLYPDIRPNVTHAIAVDEPHVLYVEECGNRQGLPVIFVHGGPGAGCEPWHRRFFDPEIYRIVLFDQRGSGKSTPHASLDNNTTPALVRDMETIRTQLGIDKWIVFGGSWGSTLGLLYAQTHPDRVLGLILRGIFLCRQCDVDWFYQYGASAVFPDYWDDYLKPIPVEERGDLLRAYHKRLVGDDEIARMAAAKAWSVWEGRCATLVPRKSVIDHFSDTHTALSLARIECHYFVNQSFIAPGQILRDASTLRDIPGVIVHGRYDVVCPIDQAWALHRAWPQAELKIITDAGHSASEPGIVDALIQATRRLAAQLQ